MQAFDDRYSMLIANASRYIGTHRGTPEGDALIAGWLKEVGFPFRYDNGNYVPYCAAFAVSMLNKTGQNNVFHDASTLNIWNRTPVHMRTNKPFSGCLFFWDFGGREGHIGFVDQLLDGGKMTTIEGNTTNPDMADGGSSERDGGWVINRTRSSVPGMIGDIRLLGFVDPFFDIYV